MAATSGQERVTMLAAYAEACFAAAIRFDRSGTSDPGEAAFWESEGLRALSAAKEWIDSVGAADPPSDSTVH